MQLCWHWASGHERRRPLSVLRHGLTMSASTPSAAREETRDLHSLPSVRLRLRCLSFTAKMCGIRGVGESFVSPIDGVRTLIGLEQARSSQKLPRLFAFNQRGSPKSLAKSLT